MTGKRGSTSPVPSLDPDAVLPQLRGAFGRTYRHVRSCPSTQDLVSHDDPEGAVAVAEHQTAGRGRSGRAWEDAEGDALLCSVLLRPPATAVLPQLSLVAALAVAEAVEGATGIAAGVKWPNDVLLDGRKVAGILLEARAGAVVCGIGVNVNQRPERLPRATRVPAGSLAGATGRPHDRGALLVLLLEALERRYREWSSSGLAAARAELDRRNVLRGRRIAAPGGTGVAGRIAEDGRLEIVLDDGTPTLVESGEVELV